MVIKTDKNTDDVRVVSSYGFHNKLAEVFNSSTIVELDIKLNDSEYGIELLINSEWINDNRIKSFIDGIVSYKGQSFLMLRVDGVTYKVVLPQLIDESFGYIIERVSLYGGSIKVDFSKSLL